MILINILIAKNTLWVFALREKKQIKKSRIAVKKFEPDFIAFERTPNNTHICYVIEVKDGDQFIQKIDGRKNIFTLLYEFYRE